MSVADKDSARHFQLWFTPYPTGEPRRITNDLNDYSGVSLTSDSSALVTIQRQSSSSIWLTGRGSSTARRISAVTGGYDGGSGIAWVPSASKLVFGSSKANTNIWEMDLDGRNLKQLTVDSGNNTSPCVTPDGRTIFFISDRTGPKNIWKMDIEGNNPTQVTNANNVGAPTITHDGKWIVYAGTVGTATSKTHHRAVWRLRTAGGEPLEVPGSSEWSCLLSEVSPDGKMIACAYIYIDPEALRDADRESVRAKIFTVDDGRLMQEVKIRPLPVMESESYRGVFELDLGWTSDSKALSYIDTVGGVSNIWIRSLTGGPPSQITSFDSDRIFSYAWSPDGKQLAIARAAETSNIVLITNFR